MKLAQIGETIATTSIGPVVRIDTWQLALTVTTGRHVRAVAYRAAAALCEVGEDDLEGAIYVESPTSGEATLVVEVGTDEAFADVAALLGTIADGLVAAGIR